MDFIFDPSLVLYLPLYEQDGASFMSKDAYGHLCTVTGALWRPNGRLFDGDDYIGCGDKNVFSFTDGAGTDKPFSVIIWFKQANATGAQYLICKHKGGGSRAYEWMLRLNAGKLQTYFTSAPGDNVSNRIGRGYDTATTLNTWYCAGLTYDGLEGEGGIKLFLNGNRVDDVSQSSGTYTGMANTATPLEIGRANTPGNYFIGQEGEVWLYSRELSPQEVQHNYLATKWRYR